MKKKLTISVLFILMLTLLFTACGDKAVTGLEIVTGMTYEFDLNETPDFSELRVQVRYNDGDWDVVGAEDLTFSELDTSSTGSKKLTITYKGFSIDVNVTVVGDGTVGGGETEDPTLTEISYLSGLDTTLFVGDTFSTSELKVLAKYSDNTTGTIAASKLVLSSIDTTTAGVKTLTISYTEGEITKTTEVSVEVVEPKVIKLEVDADSINTVVEAGGTLDISTLEITAIYDSGKREVLDATEYTHNLDDIDFNAEGNKDFIITYASDTTIKTTIVITTEPPVIESITINDTGYEKTIVIGDSFVTTGITATANYSNNTTKPIANDKLTATIDVSQVGDATLTVTYNDDSTFSATATVKVLGIKSVAIDASSVTKSIEIGEDIETTVTVIITCSDDSIVTRTATPNLDAFDNTKVGKTTITAAYGGVTSAAFEIVVTDTAVDYYVLGVSEPETITQRNSKKNNFKNSSYGYVVGDDNPFIYKLTLSVYNADGTKNESITDYVGTSKIYLDGSTTALTASELTSYVAIDENAHTYDFTEEAVGHSFKIETRPLYGVAGVEADMTRSINVTVVDAYNIYNAYELNLLTNIDDFDFSEEDPDITDTQTQIVNRFLNNKGVSIPQSLAGVVLHCDLTITTDDIPSEYFVGRDASKGIWDYLAIYAHATDETNPTFSFHGNYYTIFSYGIPNVCVKDVGNQDDHVSNSQLFRFTIADHLQVKSLDHKNYTTNIQNLYIRDDNPNADDISNADRAMLGVIGMKLNYQTINIDNTNVEAFYISMLAEGDQLTINMNQAKFFNSWQNHIFLWAKNTLASSNDEVPADDHEGIVLNVTASSITKCGGPVIISQTAGLEYTKNSKSKSTVNFLGDTVNRPLKEGEDAAATNEIWTYVTGNEAWFQAMYAADVATGIKALNGVFGGQSSFVFNNKDITGIEAEAMNIIMVNMSSGATVSEILGNTHDFDGEMLVGDKSILNMNDGENPVVDGYLQATALMNNGTPAPVFQSSEGGVAYTDGKTGVYGIDFATQATTAADTSVYQGDYITLFYSGIGIVLGYNTK